jgi:DNA-binding MarR family transcriptional regulator
MDLAPMLMRLMRQELNAQEALDLSVPQFRTLRFVARHPATSLSDLAEHLGMTLPAASKLVDRLLEQLLITRATAAGDRRRAELTLTLRGQAALKLAAAAAQAHLAERLAALSEQELAICGQALTLLRASVTPASNEQEETVGRTIAILP